GLVQEPVAVGVAREAGDRPQHVIVDGDVGQWHVAGVGDDVGEGHGGAGGHVQTIFIGVLAVDELDDVDGRGVAEVVGRVVVADLLARAVGVVAGGGADVGLLAGLGGCRFGVLLGFAQVEQPVAVGVAREAGDRPQHVVVDDDVGQ